MSELTTLLEQEERHYELPPGAFDRLSDLRERRRRGKRIAVIVLTLILMGSVIGGVAMLIRSSEREIPARPEPSPAPIEPIPEVQHPIKVEPPIEVAAPVALEPAADCPPGSTPDTAGPADQARPAGRTGPMTFDRDSHRIVALIGLRRDEPALARLWTFDVCTNTWSPMGPSIALSNQDDDPALAYDPGTGRVVLMGPGWVRTYDETSDTWSLSGAPGHGPSGPEVVLDPATGRFVVLDGSGDLWSYDVAEDRWWRVEQVGEIPDFRGSPADGGAMLRLETYLPSTDRVVQYIGHCDLETGGASATTWEFDLRTRTWSQVLTETPVVTNFHCGWSLPDIGEANAYNEASRLMVIFTPDRFFTYNAGAHRWTTGPTGASAPPLEPFDDVVYDPVNERLVVYGDGMWAFDPATRTWTLLLAPSGS